MAKREADVQLVRRHDRLGHRRLMTGDYGRAWSHFEQALAIRQRLLAAGGVDVNIHESLNNLEMLLDAVVGKPFAEPYLDRALAVWMATLGANHPETAAILNNLGYCLKERGELDRAQDCYEQALFIWKQTLGTEHVHTAACLNNLGALFKERNNMAGARHYYQEALDIFEQVHGRDHPDVATSLNNLGLLLQQMGQPVQARYYLERALAIWQRHLGPEHSEVAAGLHNLSTLLWAEGHPEQARACYEQAVTIWQQRSEANQSPRLPLFSKRPNTLHTSVPLIALVVLPLFGRTAAFTTALVMLPVLLLICWGVCGWRMLDNRH